MKIMVPIADEKNIDAFSKAGADEFYFGIYDDTWTRRFGIFEEINRMSSFGSRANIPVENLESFVYAVKKSGKKLYITFNSPAYSNEELSYIDNILDNGIYDDIDGIIIGDPTLIEICHEHNKDIILSTMAGAYNSDIIDFYRKCGIKRIIIPRDVQLRDIETIAKKFKDIEFEVFLMRNGCKYSDSNCMSFHGRKYNSMCSCMDRTQPKIYFGKDLDTEGKMEVYSNNKLFTQAFHKESCGI